jgi:hypothetical protein
VEINFVVKDVFFLEIISGNFLKGPQPWPISIPRYHVNFQTCNSLLKYAIILFKILNPFFGFVRDPILDFPRFSFSLSLSLSLSVYFLDSVTNGKSRREQPTQPENRKKLTTNRNSWLHDLRSNHIYILFFIFSKKGSYTREHAAFVHSYISVCFFCAFRLSSLYLRNSK